MTPRCTQRLLLASLEIPMVQPFQVLQEAMEVEGVEVLEVLDLAVVGNHTGIIYVTSRF